MVLSPILLRALEQIAYPKNWPDLRDDQDNDDMVKWMQAIAAGAITEAYNRQGRL